MDIKFMDDCQRIPFEELHFTDCFILEKDSPSVFMKIYEIVDKTGKKFNAIDLDDSQLDSFRDVTKVIPVDAELRVKS